MKTKVLLLFMVLLFSVSYAEAEDWDRVLDPYHNEDHIYQQEAAPYINYVKDKWRLYEVSIDSFNKLERATQAEYQAKRFNFSVELDMEDLNPSIKTKIGLFGKPIYFVFTIEN